MRAHRHRLSEIALVFLKLGTTAFGGPAAYIAMMQEEVVERRQWLSRQHFLDLVGATNLIPGPNATEMAIHCGYVRAGWRGLILAGLCFITPAALISGLLGNIYLRYQTLPALSALIFGIKPAVIAIILRAIWQLAPGAVKSWHLALIGLTVIAMALFNTNEITAIFTGGGLGMILLYLSRRNFKPPVAAWLPLGFTSALVGNKNLALTLTATTTTAVGFSLFKLFLIFFKIGAVLFGSGYVLIAYLEGELVQRLGWLTMPQLLDAIAVGQITPGPLLSTATFIGYQIAGFKGAILATVGVFLPSFFFVALTNPFIAKLRHSFVTSCFLDAVNVSALGLMVAVTLQLGQSVLVDWKSILIALASLVLIFRFKRLNSTWIILGSAGIGYLLQMADAWF